MAHIPSAIAFVCEACQRPAKPRRLRRTAAGCPRCDGRSWKLVVDYADTEIKASPLGLLSFFAFGFGWMGVQKSTNRVSVEGVPAEVVAVLTEHRSLVVARVAEYLRLRDRQELRERGARPCLACNVLFVPAEDKPWTQQGWCSKSCAAKEGAIATPAADAPAVGRTRVRSIAVVCPNGHAFEVAASFAGCIRPCVECGAKTSVP